jgi:hypothetical protein
MRENGQLASERGQQLRRLAQSIPSFARELFDAGREREQLNAERLRECEQECGVGIELLGLERPDTPVRGTRRCG